MSKILGFYFVNSKNAKEIYSVDNFIWLKRYKSKACRAAFTTFPKNGLTWDKLEGSPLNHPEMDYPGARIKCPFRLGNMKGFVRMDLALGDIVEAAFIPLQKLKYRGEPLAGKDFKILSYPPETIFSEKYQTAVSRGADNTRMKDFYDLHKLCLSGSLNSKKLKRSLEATFKNRKTPVVTELQWSSRDLERIQIFWAAYLKKEDLEDAPKKIEEIIAVINTKLKNANPSLGGVPQRYSTA